MQIIDRPLWQFFCPYALLTCVVVSGCNQKTSTSSGHGEKPAKVEKLPSETDLATITLTADALRRLGITTAAVEQKEIRQRRTLSGQVVVPSGKTIIVTSPLAGTVATTGRHPLPTPGSSVDPENPLLMVKPLLSAERDVPTPAEQVQIVGARANLMAARTVAAGDVERGRAEVEAAQIALDRSQKLFADRAGARRAVDDAEAQLNIANSNLEAAEQREKQLAELLKMLDAPTTEGEATALPMTTPISGIVNRIEVREGQTISSGAMLFEVVNLDTVWIRVPVFVDLLTEIDTTAAVQLVRLSGGSLDSTISATPIAAPPTADAMSSTADLYYQIDNSKLNLRPGQRVGVELPLVSPESSLVVPSKSLLYDIYGNGWVYTKSGEKQFTRARVDVRFVEGDSAVLAAGPKPGTPVVVDGAAELFGTEFGAGK
ncbi:MAG: HlyD family efflux transporter periplasmic adaptor subunit [Phycisphaera sp. RhM]|nr:HlyD family efflux transporter periplasmic adaptor subunit [Phycisphaera sp. RhM]